MSRNRVPFVLRSPSEKSMHPAREGSLALSVAGPGADGPETRDVLGTGPRRGIDLVEISIRYRQRRGPSAGRVSSRTISGGQVGLDRARDSQLRRSRDLYWPDDTTAFVSAGPSLTSSMGDDDTAGTC